MPPRNKYELDTQCERHVKARIHADTETFAHSIAIDRVKPAYPDPPLTRVSDDALEQYHKRLGRFRANYTPADAHERDKMNEFFAREQMRCNIERGKRAFPEDLHELGIPDDVIDLFNALSFDTGYGLSIHGRQMDWDAYDKLMNNVALDHLRAYAAKKAVHGQNHVDRNRPDLINAIRYVRGDPTVSLDNIINFVPFEQAKQEVTLKVDGEEVEPERGIPYDAVKNELRRIVRSNPTAPMALALANIGKATNYNHPKFANGSQNAFRTNFANTVEDDDKQNVVAHEFFHSLQEVFGIAESASMGHWVDHEADPSEWTPTEYIGNVHPYLKRLQERVTTHWHKVRCQFRGLVRPYQAKNPNELTAVAFETYVEQPDKLQAQQPDLHDTIEATLKSPVGQSPLPRA